MKLLRRTLGQLFWRDHRNVGTPEVRNVEGPVVGREESAQDEIARLCSDGLVWEAARLANKSLISPASPADAVEQLRHLVLPVMEECGRRGLAGLACELEELAYSRLVKAFEDPAHHDSCFSLMDACLYRLGCRSRSIGLADLVNAPRSLLFFAHNLAQEYAHLALACDLIEAYLSAHPEQVHNIGLVGVTNGALAGCVKRLQERWDINIEQLDATTRFEQAYSRAVGLINTGRFDRLVFVSVPIGLSYCSGLLPISRLAWLSMKYELSCFSQLGTRCSFRSGIRSTEQINGVNWHRAAPLFTAPIALKRSGNPPPALERARNFGTIFYTVNREDKTRNSEYLDAVASILEQVPDSVFVWTGRQRLQDIDAFFHGRGLDHRHLFAGWVVPDDLVLDGDVFLDTPVLSGNVAAQAAAAGKAVVTDANAISWLGTFLPRHAEDEKSGAAPDLSAQVRRLNEQGLALRARSRTEYVAQAVLLASQPTLRDEFGRALAAFAARYYFDAQRAAVDHFDNLRFPVVPA